MEKSICYVFGAGEYYETPPIPPKRDFVIAVDGGYDKIQNFGIEIDLLVGDFDSIRSKPDHVNLLTLPEEKDDTDMMVAIREGYERGCRIFHIYGGTGGRFDHTLSNVQCLAYLTSIGACGFLYEKESVITTMRAGEIHFSEEAKGMLSVFAYTEEATGVTEEGLRYSLQEATLRSTYPVGVSNEFIGGPSKITVRSGILMLVYPKDTKPVFMKPFIEKQSNS